MSIGQRSWSIVSSILSRSVRLQGPCPAAAPCSFHFQLEYFQRRWKVDDRRAMVNSMPLKDMGTQGERGTDVDLLITSKDDMFPTEDTPNSLFNGVRFDDLPIAFIKASKNNTLIKFQDAKGNPIAFRSCGVEGFKNTRKGTNIAAQATAITIGSQVLKKNVKQVRIRVQGLGPGRLSSIKGLQMAGLEIISLTDDTPISYNPPRAKKRRRI